ncbi:MAG: hypothetical protein WDZ52_06515 [Pseudohongiellaceae bacterium]
MPSNRLALKRYIRESIAAERCRQTAKSALQENPTDCFISASKKLTGGQISRPAWWAAGSMQEAQLMRLTQNTSQIPPPNSLAQDA